MTIEPPASSESGKLDSLRGGRKNRRRQFAFRAFCLLSPLLLVMFVNSALYCFGIGVDTRLVVRSARASAGNVFSFNMQTDFAYSNIDLRGPEPRPFDLPKPASTFRVVVIGESSVQGFPYPSELAFPRQLELILSRQLPSKHVEVLNAGIVGLSTTPLVDITRQALASDPDSVIVYAGHNEFYGIGGVATTAPIGRLGLELRRYRFIQLLSRFTPSSDQPSEMLIARLPSDFCVPLDSDVFRRAEDTYRANLVEMTRICERSKVPLLLCSVVSNLHDQSPIASCATIGDADKPTLEGHLQSARRSVEAGQYEGALKELDDAEKLDPNYALTAYRKAQSLEALQRLDEAATAYSTARDLDGCRFRAPSTFREIVRETAYFAARPHVHFVDLVQTFSEAAISRTPGHELFWEHVHFTLEGHWLVAQTLAQRVVEDICHQEWNLHALPSTAERDEWLDLIPLDQLSATILTSFIVQSPPLDKAADAADQLRILNGQIQDLTRQIPPTDMRLFKTLAPQTKIDDLLHGLGQLKLDKGDTAAALGLFERAQRRRPWMPHSYVYAAICHHLLGDDKQARADLTKSYETVVAETERLRLVRGRLEEELH